MKKAVSVILAVLLCAICAVSCAESTYHSEYAGLWYLGTTGYGSDYVIATELIFNEDHTVTYLCDDDASGYWDVVRMNGKETVELEIRTSLGYTEVHMNYDESEGIYKANYAGLYYTLSRETPIKELNVKNKEDAELTDYEGVWIPHRMFVSGTEMPIKEVLADDLKISVESIETEGVAEPIVKIYQDIEDDDRVDENVCAFMQNSWIHYCVLNDQEEYLSEKEENVKYFGDINLREDGKLVMTMEYEGIVKLTITLVKEK